MKLRSFLSISVFLVCVLFVLTACGSDEPSEPETISEQPQASVARGKVVNADSSGVPEGSPTKISNDGTNAEAGQTSDSEGGEDAAENANTASFDIIMNDSYYGESDDNVLSPPTWTVESGKIMLINVENAGKEKHNWVIMQPGAEIPTPYEEGQNSDMIFYNPGMVYAESKTQLVVNAPDPGEYAVICTVSGHYPFMQGRLIVSAKN